MSCAHHSVNINEEFELVCFFLEAIVEAIGLLRLTVCLDVAEATTLQRDIL